MSKQNRNACFGKEFHAIELASTAGHIDYEEYKECKRIRFDNDEVAFVAAYNDTCCETCDAPEGFTFYMHDDIYLHMCVPCILKRYKK